MPITIPGELGSITFTDEIITIIAGYAAAENYGIVGMASKRATDGFVELLGKENVKKGVLVSTADGKILIDVHIIVEYGVSLVAVSENVKQNVAYRVNKLTGVDVKAVNVHVEGIRVNQS